MKKRARKKRGYIKNSEYPHSYKGRRCKLMSFRKIWIEVQFKNGKRMNIEYFDLNS